VPCLPIWPDGMKGPVQACHVEELPGLAGGQHLLESARQPEPADELRCLGSGLVTDPAADRLDRPINLERQDTPSPGFRP
jgi:hypothetical protein